MESSKRNDTWELARLLEEKKLIIKQRNWQLHSSSPWPLSSSQRCCCSSLEWWLVDMLLVRAWLWREGRCMAPAVELPDRSLKNHRHLLNPISLEAGWSHQLRHHPLISYCSTSN
uniref:Uncharacterized protein n=1 Tax=Kalanchoe fedtschenkoi TaxID=63787 RepID=A0A7N0RHR2_KALFE